MRLPKKENLIMTNEEDPLNFYYYPVIGWVYRKRLINTLELLGQKKFEKLLEIGFGSGILFSELSTRTRELHGIEIHDKIPAVSQKMAREGLRPILKQASIYELPYEDNFFDCIVSVSTFEHLTDLDKAFQEIRRIARPGAQIVISFPVRNAVTDVFYSAVGFTPRDLHPNSHRDILEAAAKYLHLERLKKFPSFLPLDNSLYLSGLFTRTNNKPMSRIQEHFDSLAPGYDEWKKRNSYYYQSLKNLYREFIPPGKRILDFGCGTGGVLADLQPSRGVGIDISSEMIKRAKSKFAKAPHLYFTDSWEDPQIQQEKYDFIISADVVEHLEDVPGTFRYLRGLCDGQTTLIVSMANPAWEPILMILEKLNLKMHEGPHKRISFSALREILDSTGFRVEEIGTRVLIPTGALPFADFINRRFHSSRLLKKFGLIGYLVAKPKT